MHAPPAPHTKRGRGPRRLAPPTAEGEEDDGQKFRALFDNVRDAIVIHDLSGRIREVNRAACERLGYSHDELVRMTVDQAEPQQDPLLIAERIATLREHGSMVFETTVRLRDGTLLPVEVNASLFVHRGEPLILSAGRDLSERMRAEEDRRLIETHVRQAQKLESLGILAGGIAHDFNNLLTVIVGQLGLVRGELPAGSPAAESLRRIDEASRRATELCRQLLAYSGKGRFVVEHVDLSRIVQDMVPVLQASVSKRATLRWTCPAGLPGVDADAAQLRQALMNLVVNASEALADRDGVISVETGTLQLAAGAQPPGQVVEVPAPGSYAYLQVSDTGCGMDAETQARVFDPFFTTKFTGRGLGLAAVLGITRSHAGGLELVTRPGAGTRCRVLLPVSAGSGEGLAPRAEVGKARLGRGSVLVVDDEELVLDVTRQIIEHCGLSALTATSGREAVDLFRERSQQIACVLLDLTMPQMDGIETLRALRALQPEVRVVLASGYSEQEIEQRLGGQRPTAFIAKPYTLDTLGEKLREVLASA